MKYTVYLVAAMGGVAVGLLIPAAVKQIVAFKCKKNGRPVPEKLLSKPERSAIILVSAGLSVLSVYFAAPEQAPFYVIFWLIAIIGTLVDNQIRVIPNELVLMLLIVGLVYRRIFTENGTLMESLAALLLAVGILASSAGITFFFKKNIGIGAGDVKLIAAIAFIMGLSGVYLFLFGMVLAILIYCIFGLASGKLIIGSSFPMCGQIMAGFVIALFVPYFIPIISIYLSSVR